MALKSKKLSAKMDRKKKKIKTDAELARSEKII